MSKPSFQENKRLDHLCTFGIGGPARYFTEAFSIEEMQQIITYCKEQQLRFFVLGKGSNCLFDDRGFNGVVILNKIDFCHEVSSGTFYVGAGHSFSLLGSHTARRGWSGLEFASGIPGSVGGAVFMNAGANGKETCETLLSVEYVSDTGELISLDKTAIHFAYRTSSFQEHSGAIVSATFALTSSETARTKQLEIIQYRKNTQPYKARSAGCIFRNPPNKHAGALIEQSGLKGAQTGGAQVSEVHANFLVNTGNATASDVLRLIATVKESVKTQQGIELESEVRFIPFGE